MDFDAASIAAFHTIFSQFYGGPSIGGGCAVVDELPNGSSVDGFDYTPLDGASGAVSVPVSYISTNTQAPLPAQNCEVITIRTASRGRQNRGRVYLPAFHNLVSDADGHILAAAITCILTQLGGVVAALGTAGAHLGVGSYGPYKDPVTHLLVAGTPHFTPMTAATMDNRFDVQRKRKQ